MKQDDKKRDGLRKFNAMVRPSIYLVLAMSQFGPNYPTPINSIMLTWIIRCSLAFGLTFLAIDYIVDYIKSNVKGEAR